MTPGSKPGGKAPARTYAVSLEQIVAMLADRIEALCAALLPAGRREGPEWVEAGTRQGGLGDSLRVHLTAPRRGVWAHFAAGRKGDALDLIAYLAARDDKSAAIRWARDWLGLSGDPARRPALPDPAKLAQARAAADKAAAEDLAKQRGRAQRLWLAAQPGAGTPAELYLRARGIAFARLGRWPGALRFDPACWCSEVERRLPALLASVEGPLPGGGAGFLTVHRTWLAQDRAGIWRKAELESPKKAYSPYLGGTIRLHRGASGRRLAEARPGETVLIAEGVENALTAACAKPELRALACVALPNLASVALPEAVAEVAIVADNDAPGSKAQAALLRAIDALKRQGRRVSVIRVTGAKDVNDLVRAAEPAA